MNWLASSCATLTLLQTVGRSVGKRGAGDEAGAGAGAGARAGDGIGVSFLFQISCFNFCRSILLYCYCRMTGSCPSFMVQKYPKRKKKFKELTEAMKALKEHLNFFLKSDFFVF